MPDKDATPTMTNSHILYNTFDYYEPASLDEASALLLAHSGAGLLAGGTDLLVHMKMERSAPTALISLRRISGLAGVAADGDGLRIGAMTTIRDLERSPAVSARYQALAEACASFSSTQVQSMGTIGGNLGNASPAADSAPALLAFGAQVELAGPPLDGAQGARRLQLSEFFRGPGRSALHEGELIRAVVLPRPGPGTGSVFLKIGRVANDIAKASCAVVITRGAGDDRIVDCRLAFGSVAPTPMRTPRAEALLIGQPWSEDLADAAAALAAEEVAPIDDVRSTGWYRREIVQVMAADGLRRAWQRAHLARAERASPAEGVEGRPMSSTRALSPVEGRPAVPYASPAEGVAGRSSARMLAAGERRLVELRVNGRRRQVWAKSNDLLLNVLREDLQLTGTKYGCGIGECSACTVLLDGEPALACLVLAVTADGHDVLTIEGLAGPDGMLDPLQEAFLDYAAYQCGYCTPGMLLTAKHLLAEKPQPSEDDVRHYLRGNLCRCTGYASIVRAVLAAAEEAPNRIRGEEAISQRGKDAARIRVLET